MKRELDTLLRSCIDCGLCLPHCATYLATGDETQSPRGRLTLLRAFLDRPDAADRSVHEAFDLCLGCRACETACPSGVPYDLLAAAKDLAHRTLDPPSGPLLDHLASRPTLRTLRLAGSAATATLRATLGAEWRRRLDSGLLSGPARRLGSLPASPGDRDLIARLDTLTGLATPSGARPRSTPGRRSEVAFFAGCAGRELLPATQARLLSLLDAAGVDVTSPDGQDCCGALDAHTGRSHVARARHARNTAALAGAVARTVVLLVEAAGCGLELRDHPPAIADAVVDAVVYLSGSGLPPLREVPLRVAYHDPCHARHGQGIVDEPRALLARIPGVTVLEPEEADVCCGSGGAYALVHADLSAAMGRRKAACLAATGADVVATSNPGCLGQIADAFAREGLDTPVLPLTDLLWYASLVPTSVE